MALDVLKSSAATATIKPKDAGGQKWVMLVGIGFIALVLVAMVYWILNRNNDKRGMTAVDTNE